MRRAVCLAAWVLLLAQPLRAEIYRCVQPDGSVRFTGDPSACSNAERHVLERALQRAAPAAQADASAGAAEPAAAWRGSHTDLLGLFPVAASLGAGWEIVEEAASDPLTDPDLRKQGVRTTAARHYTRGHGRVAQVCTLEIWAFEDSEAAARAQTALVLPDWRLQREANLLLTLRGVTLDLGRAPRNGIASECDPLIPSALARWAARRR